jgi:hypothetical protein
VLFDTVDVTALQFLDETFALSKYRPKEVIGIPGYPPSPSRSKNGSQRGETHEVEIGEVIWGAITSASLTCHQGLGGVTIIVAVSLQRVDPPTTIFAVMVEVPSASPVATDLKPGN